MKYLVEISIDLKYYCSLSPFTGGSSKEKGKIDEKTEKTGTKKTQPKKVEATATAGKKGPTPHKLCPTPNSLNL
jgi:hypothetical protein